MSVLDKFLDAIKLNDDYEDEDYYDDDELMDEDDDDFDEDKPKKKFFEKFSKKKSYDDDLDEEDNYQESVKESPKNTSAATVTKISTKTASVKAAPRTSSKITPLRSPKRNQGGNMEVCVIKPTSMEDTREIADTLVENATVILNLEGIDVELAQRIIDFTSGACYSVGGTLQKVSSYIFVLGPSNVDITGDLQNILNGSMPSVRAGY